MQGHKHRERLLQPQSSQELFSSFLKMAKSAKVKGQNALMSALAAIAFLFVKEVQN
jgi:hypothetical protein